MAPSLANWKELIDNGNSALTNATEMAAAEDQPLSPQHPEQPQQPPAGLGSSNMLPVYCGLLGCLIVGLVAWIVFKHLSRRTQQEDKQQLPTEMELQHQQRQHHHQHQRHRQHQLEQEEQEQEQQRQQLLFQFPLMGPKRRSADSGFCGSDAAVDVAGGVGRRLLRDMSESRMQRLENILANDPDPDGWRRLARELGLSADELARLEGQSSRGNQSAIRLMLKTWAARDGSSVGQLVRCLRRAGRSDALILFRETSMPAGLKRAQRKMRSSSQQQQEDQDLLQQQQPQPQSEVAATFDVAETADVNESTTKAEPSTSALPASP